MKPLSQYKLVKLLLNDEFDIRHKLQNVLLMVSLAGSMVSVIISLILSLSSIGNLVSFGAVVILSVTLYVSAVKKKKKAASYIISIFVNMVVFPVLFIFCGGLYSGMTIWYTFGLIFPWIIVTGKACWILFGLNFISAVACICLQIVHPEVIHTPESVAAFAFDVIQTMLVVCFVLGLVFKYQGRVYEEQQRRLEIQEEELRGAVKAAEEANAAKSTFLASMSHEIRTPINAVLGMDEMILRESNSSEITGYAINIQSAGHLLLSIINDILDFSKIESNKMEIYPVNYSIYGLIGDCYNMIIKRAVEKNLEVIVENDEKTPKILLGDDIRIRQIVVNMLTNAVKYTSRGSIRLCVSYENTGDNLINLLISVADTGMGISEENQKLLFSTFGRVDEEKNHGIEGTGLGLSICKQLTELMGGTISVSSELGKGSVFSISIPQRVISSEPMGVFKADGLSSGIEKYHESFHAPKARILVVDDVKMNVDVMKGLLKKTRAQIDAAYSGKECLGLAKMNKYDIIFMDHLMPEMDGVKTLELLKKENNSPNRDTPSIALTANAMIGAEEEYRSYGFDGYIAKPVKSSQLEEILLQYLPKELIEVTEASVGGDSPAYEAPDVLDTRLGVYYCCGDPEFYRKILRAYADGEKISELSECFADENWAAYGELSCGIKGSSLNIGANELAEQARRMEAAAKNGETDDLKARHQEFLSCYRRLLDKIQIYINEGGTSA